MLCLVTQSCPTLCNPMDCSPPGSSVHGDSPSKNTGVGGLSLLQVIFLTQELNWGLLHLSLLQADSLPAELPGRPLRQQYQCSLWHCLVTSQRHPTYPRSLLVCESTVTSPWSSGLPAAPPQDLQSCMEMFSLHIYALSLNCTFLERWRFIPLSCLDFESAGVE